MAINNQTKQNKKFGIWPEIHASIMQKNFASFIGKFFIKILKQFPNQLELENNEHN
jgi:hypothetical protein